MTDFAPPSSFGEVLRSWRRARRLSQADLAHAIETPPRHVSFLETGRSKPSRDMVTRLAAAMDVPLRDRNLMLRTAGFADLYQAGELSSGEMQMLKDAVSRMMRAHDPFPSFVIDRYWHVRDANASARQMLSLIAASFPFDDIHSSLNMLDITFSPEGFRPFITNWDDYARQSLQRIHREALSPVDLRAALDRVARYPDLPGDWWALDVQYTLSPVFPIQMLNGEREMNFFSVLAVIGSPTGSLAQELRVETLFPADDATEQALLATAR
ncbi:helix-turn-helix transcriptional regulator [Cognatiyoonia sp. IB215446]|uniref:helix-turn-helix domain-containing protein n=1 Tax=Cognatiyoonia sp. IB215446 TaxID=3097355 RepID=UPI002A0E852D|nr:helix-turn-helix transcriptional regulator [Cognatiyoonia sp. IB215446]MDX8348093.1 helix-turn-helix transcriptional regulator [Cognatiyoonia sp. IB215446]